MASRSTCSRESIPQVQLALNSKRCRGGMGQRVNTPTQIAEFVTKHWGCEAQEHFLVFALTPRNEILSVSDVATGSFDQAMMDPRVIFGTALLAGATSIILAHTHPSGDPEPSEADKASTKILGQAGRLLSIRVLDHIIVARGGEYVSMQARGIALSGLGSEQAAYAGRAVPPMSLAGLRTARHRLLQPPRSLGQWTEQAEAAWRSHVNRNKGIRSALAEWTEADASSGNHARDKASAMLRFREQVRAYLKGEETMAVAEMYERAAWRAGNSHAQTQAAWRAERHRHDNLTR